MGDENSPLTAAEARHLLRRTGFGARPAEIADFTNLTRGAAADRLLNFTDRPKPFRPNARDFPHSHNKWIKQLLQARSPLQAKLALFWHDHFSTAISKVEDTGLMADQIALFY